MQRPSINPNRSPSGFTLMELLVTVAIVMVLASITLPFAELAVKRNHEQQLRGALWQIREALDAYKKAADDGRIAVDADGAGYPKTLEILVTGVEDIKDPKKRTLYFLRRIPRDPFNLDESLPTEKTWGIRSYSSAPDSPEEGDNVFDIYSLSKETGINGVPYKDW